MPGVSDMISRSFDATSWVSPASGLKAFPSCFKSFVGSLVEIKILSRRIQHSTGLKSRIPLSFSFFKPSNNASFDFSFGFPKNNYISLYFKASLVENKALRGPHTKTNFSNEFGSFFFKQ